MNLSMYFFSYTAAGRKNYRKTYVRFYLGPGAVYKYAEKRVPMQSTLFSLVCVV